MRAFFLAAAVALAAPAHAKPPATAKAFPFPTELHTLPNGLRLVLIPYDSPGLVAYYTLMRVGSRNEAEPGRSGYAHFFEHMMFRGTPTHSGDEYNRTIGVAGGYTPDVVDKLRAAVATLPEKGAPTGEIPPQAPHKPRVLVVEKETASTAISIGVSWSLTRNSPDFAAWLVARSAFGEHRQFNGRLMQRLREARGLNYGDYAYIEHFVQEGGDAAAAQTGRARRQGEFTIWLRPVQNENALFAARAALYELQRTFTEEPFSDDEVERTKGFLDGYVLLYAQTDARKLGYALDDRALGSDQAFLEKLRGEIAKVTTADVNRVWAAKMKALLPQLQIVMVTPKAQEMKKAIVTNASSPMHYQKDAQGRVHKKPDALLAADKVIEKFALGVSGDADVEVIPVAKLFQ